MSAACSVPGYEEPLCTCWFRACVCRSVDLSTDSSRAILSCSESPQKVCFLSVCLVWIISVDAVWQTLCSAPDHVAKRQTWTMNQVFFRLGFLSWTTSFSFVFEGSSSQSACTHILSPSHCSQSARAQRTRRLERSGFPLR